jgi:hypothetical protein
MCHAQSVKTCSIEYYKKDSQCTISCWNLTLTLAICCTIWGFVAVNTAPKANFCKVDSFCSIELWGDSQWIISQSFCAQLFTSTTKSTVQNFISIGQVVSVWRITEFAPFPQGSEVVLNTVLSAAALARDRTWSDYFANSRPQTL